MDPGIAGILGAAVGSAITWMLGELSALNRENRIDARQCKSIRLVLRAEADHNLMVAREILAVVKDKPLPESVTAHESEQARNHLGSQVWAARFARLANPEWTMTAWNGLAPSVALALSELEIKKLMKFYGDLEAISAIHANLALHIDEEVRYEPMSFLPGRNPTYVPIHPQKFKNLAPDAWQQCEGIIIDLLSAGNPVGWESLTGRADRSRLRDLRRSYSREDSA